MIEFVTGLTPESEIIYKQPIGPRKVNGCDLVAIKFETPIILLLDNCDTSIGFDFVTCGHNRGMTP